MNLTPLLPLPPASEKILLARAQRLAGLSIAEVAAMVGMTMPKNLNHHKGWVGDLLELALGASAMSKPEPDFPHLGIELKSIPLNEQGTPLESTYICHVPLGDLLSTKWEESWLCHKLARVLWVPVIAPRHIPLGERRFATPFIWSPSPEQATQLQQDWLELMELIWSGEVERITAHHGTLLQIRPKAANARSRTAALGPDGSELSTNPRGFYLRTGFTQTLLHHYFI
ncbi:MAG: DNA mismatch repair endonuclease MutH [Gammaproteobacteria bacterium]|nr:DNA mismatch repair endonuclease MutH [Gammaproteobacteria bacterium]